MEITILKDILILCALTIGGSTLDGIFSIKPMLHHLASLETPGQLLECLVAVYLEVFSSGWWFLRASAAVPILVIQIAKPITIARGRLNQSISA